MALNSLDIMKFRNTLTPISEGEKAINL